MKQTVFKGAACAIVTPFVNDETINFEEFTRMIEFQIANKTDAIVVAGTTGEASVMYDEMHLAAVAHCVNVVNKRVPVIAGCGSNHTHHAIRLSVGAQKLGANALLQVTPYYNKTTQAGLAAHFGAIASAVDIPVILYNVPGRTGMCIMPETYLQLSKIENIVATKEASGDIAHMMKIAALCGSEMPMYSGNDDQIASTLAMGGLGVISVLSNIVPKKIHQLCSLHFAGNHAACMQLQTQLIGLCDAMFCEVNPIPVKQALNMMGFNAGRPLLPLVEAAEKSKAFIAAALKKEGLI